MHKLALQKPDGRRLVLYGLDPPSLSSPPPVPGAPVHAEPQMRWHPLRGEWVAYAAHREDRTFLPPPEYNPLAPTRPGGQPTELPAGRYDVAVFENQVGSTRSRCGTELGAGTFANDALPEQKAAELRAVAVPDADTDGPPRSGGVAG
jgi:hypothetical protein